MNNAPRHRDHAFEMLLKEIGLPVTRRPEWSAVHFGKKFQADITFLGNHIMLSRPSGYATLRDTDQAFKLGYEAIRQCVPDGSPYVLIEDYKNVSGASLDSRKFAIKDLSSRPNVLAMIFCNTSALFNISIKLAKKIYKLKTEIFIAKDLSEALKLAENIVSKENPALLHRVTSDKIKLRRDITSEENWAISLEGYSMRFERINGNILHAVSSGYLRDGHVAPIFDLLQKVFDEMNLKDGTYSLVCDHKQLKGATIRARRNYVEGFRNWHIRHPVNKVIHYNTNWVLRAAINISKINAPFEVFVVDDLNAAISLASEKSKREYQQPLKRKSDVINFPQKVDLKTYSDELIQMLSELNWESKSAEEISQNIDPSHPFSEVMEAISLIKMDMDQVLSEQKKVEKELRLSEEKFSKAFNLGPIIITISKVSDGTYVEASEYFLKTTEYTREEVIGRTTTELNIWKNEEDLERVIKAVMETGAVHEWPIWFQSKNKKEYLMLFSAEIVRIKDRSHFVSVAVDITDRKKTELALQESEEKFRLIFEHAPYAVVINSMENGRIVDANKAFIDSRGITKEEELSQIEFNDISTMNDDKQVEILEEIIKTGSINNVESEIINRDGTIGYIESSSVVINVEGQKQILSMIVDVTERKHAENALKESEARFRALFTNAPIPLVNATLDGDVISINNRFTQVFGYTIDDISHIDHWWVNAYPDPEYRNAVKSDWEKAVAGATENNNSIEPDEFSVTCKNGKQLIMIISANVIGNTMIISFFDITERKESEKEREKLQQQLYQSQKLDAIGILAGGVAHDFNNMLAGIMGYTEMTIKDMDPSDPLQKNLYTILDITKRSASLTRQLLSFARKQTIEPIIFDLNEAIEAILKMIRRIIGENIELAWLPGAGSTTVCMDPSQFDQVMVNLCVNSRDAISNTGRITIETGAVSFDEAYCASHVYFTPGQYVLLAISDDGSGMEKETLNHIFDPFFTTKKDGQGTGMGLPTVYGIVKQNSGFINVYSEFGQGTTIKIYLPLDTMVTDKEELTTIEKIPSSRGETILIVEDEPSLLEMNSIMLEHLGYVVLSAGKPSEAIHIIQESSNNIHLVITDVVMPEMNGRELVDQLKRIKPEIKHLFMSGYTANIIAHQGVLDKGVNFIQKPFTLKDLAIKIRKVLDN
jgi:PAS domain S-box-containing protein